MKKTLLTIIVTILTAITASAQSFSATWSLSNKDNLSACVVKGEAEYTALITTDYTQGSNITASSTMTASGADTGYSAVTYTPAFTCFAPSVFVSSPAANNQLSFGITPASGHKVKITRISFDAAKCGTDKGGIELRMKTASGSEKTITSASPLRNKITNGNETGYSHYDVEIPDFVANNEKATVSLYLYEVGTSSSIKSIAVRNVTIEGAMDEEVYNFSHYVTSYSFNSKIGMESPKKTSIISSLRNLKNGESYRYPTKLSAVPDDFTVGLNPTLSGDYAIETTYENNIATTIIKKNGSQVFKIQVVFTVNIIPAKDEAKPLDRGLVAVKTSAGVFVNWRARKSDKNVRYMLYSNGSLLERGGFTEKTNYLDSKGTTNSSYSLYVVDAATGAVIEKQENVKVWSEQSHRIDLEGGAPTDPTTNKATYTPNDASFCDMDGDGEYEIILKWTPSTEKDAASSGPTPAAPAFYGCYKLDGKRLWLLHTGQNMFNSAHTTPFIAWDLDGDGYGEFIVKTAPGAVDGLGNYVLLGSDSPTTNLLSGRGKQDHGSEYISVFDGTTGAELKTIPYHTDYSKGSSYWGDSNQNRSERYNACIAWLDGEDANPSAIFNRGYYAGAFIGAYDWDGSELTCRWVHRAYSATNGVVEYADGTKKTLTKTVYAEGAHWLTGADLDGDGKHEIQFGSAALDHDGTTLYRTGLGHGDAVHIGDFLPEKDGLEMFMPHEESPYGVDLRNAKTGKAYLYWNKNTHSSMFGGDTGRGLAAHFDSSRPDAQFMHSASASLFNCADGSVNSSSWTIGSSGAGINARVYWTGDLYDEFFDKSIIAHWNPENMSFDRISVNGSNYLAGKLNNSSKNNPCVIGDIVGDYREEIITWEEGGSTGFRLIVNTTNYASENKEPHLMDDIQYRENVVSQNSSYNQPPHLSYDPATQKVIKGKTKAMDGARGTWAIVYAPYPVTRPSNVTTFSFGTSADNVQDTLKWKKITDPVVTNYTLLVYADKETEFEFRPIGSTVTTVKSGGSANRLYESNVDSLVCTTASYSYYEIREGAKGFGAYIIKDRNKRLKANTPWTYYTASTYNHDFYAIAPDKKEILLGDANNDGKVTVEDADMVVNYYLGLNPASINIRNANVNQDNVIDMSDANEIINVYLKNQK